MPLLVNDDIFVAKELLCAGKLVAIPTETVYGLAANAFDPVAVQQIFDLKQRPSFNPLIVHIGNRQQWQEVVADIPEKARLLADAFWPGPLTLVLPKSDRVPNIVSAQKSTVAVRMPNHALTLALLQALPFPLAAPSANPFGTISPTTARHVADYFGDSLSMVLDGGPAQQGIESTIVGFEDGLPVMYRLGTITQEEIEAVIGRVTVTNKNNHNPSAPGMLLKHYAPKTKLILVEDLPGAVAQYAHQKIAILSLQEKLTGHNIIQQVCLSESAHLPEAAAKLYASMMLLDLSGADLIIVKRLPETGIGKAINDRLERAAS
jgi:L-threonylcarbamoyladenylate synthase